MANVSVRARDIVRFARKNNIILTRGSTGWNGNMCARATLAAMALGIDFRKNYGDFWGDKVSHAIGLTSNQLFGLECGFEGWGDENVDKRYYKVGRHVAQLAGLS